MSFEKFLENCSFDISETDAKGETAVTAIFSMGFLKSFSKEFVDEYPDLAKRLVAHDLYDYMNHIE